MTAVQHGLGMLSNVSSWLMRPPKTVSLIIPRYYQ